MRIHLYNNIYFIKYKTYLRRVVLDANYSEELKLESSTFYNNDDDLLGMCNVKINVKAASSYVILILLLGT